MLKLVFDADGAIKLARAGVLHKVVAFVSCFMPEQVYAEIMKGKEKMYEDAFIIEGLVENKKVKVVKVTPMESEGLGQGERSVLVYVAKSEIDAVISDDRKFLSILESKHIPYIVPTDIIAVMAITKNLTKVQAHEALDALQPFVSESNYKAAKEVIEGG
ncbi:hypothetical protein HYV79_01860 [Candidatus Woesearchaeota archaeon]|nr:hypothetical protein [Candidatus Woesearchaeota archaeon]